MWPNVCNKLKAFGAEWAISTRCAGPGNTWLT